MRQACRAEPFFNYTFQNEMLATNIYIKIKIAYFIFYFFNKKIYNTHYEILINGSVF
ncbi:hypothetical protein JCM10512_1249 [Bacteroides reticulotermitis JCM 10512]|uniref:Uncharacterized protein n=1 Tax=Bacteroides reticulotermitis JCM 10512 TaxID=1445607 RepID=W4UQD5_9BACE|nr:hypothetical protein JCM10512_1249 [Bacteroides reticulotermitis JCM 10512]